MTTRSSHYHLHNCSCYKVVVVSSQLDHFNWQLSLNQDQSAAAGRRFRHINVHILWDVIRERVLANVCLQDIPHIVNSCNAISGAVRPSTLLFT